MPLFIGGQLTCTSDALTTGLAQVLFPVVLLLGLNGLLVGILQSYDRFSIAAHLAAGLERRDHRARRPAAPALPQRHLRHLRLRDRDPRRDRRAAADGGARRCSRSTSASAFTIDWHDPRVRQVFVLMLPVTIGLGIVNLDQLINSAFGGARQPPGAAPSAINYAFRIYMLPQGMFSVAVATVLFPTLSRQAARRDAGGMRRALAIGMRQINLLLIPAVGVPDGAGDAGRAADLPARAVQRELDAPRPRSRCSGSPSACRSAA